MNDNLRINRLSYLTLNLDESSLMHRMHFGDSRQHSHFDYRVEPTFLYIFLHCMCAHSKNVKEILLSGFILINFRCMK